MKKLLLAVMFVLFLSLNAQADTFEQTDFYFFGINMKAIEKMDWKMVALGAVTSIAAHTAGHYVFAASKGLDVKLDGLSEDLEKGHSMNEGKGFARAGFLMQNAVGLLLTTFPATRQHDFTKGYVAAAFLETSLYAFVPQKGGDLNESEKHGGRMGVDYLAFTAVATHNLLRTKWYEEKEQ